MDINVRNGYWIKCCMKLISVISHDNEYSQFYRSSSELVYQLTPSTEDSITVILNHRP
jgi:hypothetical protein